MDESLLPEDGSIDAGLLLLSLATERGERRTRAEIAEACGCSQALIYLIEKKAIEKLRRRAQGMLEAIQHERSYARVVSHNKREPKARTLPARMVGRSTRTLYG